MVSRMFLALAGAVLIILAVSPPVRSEGTSEGMSTSGPVCKPCLDRCYNNGTVCPKKCEEECEDGYYRVKQLKGSSCLGIGGRAGYLLQDSTGGGGTLRRRRQAPPEAAATITDLPPTAATTWTTTPAVKFWLCKKCSLQGCKRCTDGVEEELCDSCIDGYVLGNSNTTCTEQVDEEAFPAAVIAGIVIAAICLLGLVAIGAFVAVRRCRRSRDISGELERIRHHTGREGTKDSHSGSQTPKISVQELMKKHDQITCYAKDPTRKKSIAGKERFERKRSTTCESKELQNLPPAPAPPMMEPNNYIDMQQSYDHPGTKDQHESRPYAPLDLPTDELYLNVVTPDDESDNVYANTQQAVGAGLHSSMQSQATVKSNTSFRRQNHPQPLVRQESVEIYEPVGDASSKVKTEEDIYLNDETQMLVQNAKENQEEIYLNNCNDHPDDIYQNT